MWSYAPYNKMKKQKHPYCRNTYKIILTNRRNRDNIDTSSRHITTYMASCGTVALMVLGQCSDICGPKGLLGQFYGPQISENLPRTIRATVP